MRPSVHYPKSHGRRHRQSHSSVGALLRGGFTLLEVLLALGLSLVLLAAVYGALDLYWSYSMAGQVEAERSQLARAILQKMAIDIRSVMYQTQEQATTSTDTISGSSSTTDDGSTGTDDGSTTITVEDPADAYTAQSVGVYGDATTLVLHISKPVRDAGFAPNSADEFFLPQSSDLQSVSYFLAGSGEGKLQQAVNGTGLARTQGDRLALNLADESGDVDSLAAQTQLLAPEINLLEFSYFDGIEWQASWDSTTMGGVPSAIGITIGFVDPDLSINPMLMRTASTSTNQFRLVVALPLADPNASLGSY